ncbi:MAG: carbohydrate ABC transporter permease, partial [Erysipelotrichaceae bacterium]
MASIFKKRNKTKNVGIQERRNRVGFYFIIPFLVVLVTFNIYPVLRTFYLSFHSYKGFGPETFIQLDNYTRVFGSHLFWMAFGNTLKIWVVNIVVQIGLALLLTLIFSDIKFKMKGLGIF